MDGSTNARAAAAAAAPAETPGPGPAADADAAAAVDGGGGVRPVRDVYPFSTVAGSAHVHDWHCNDCDALLVAAADTHYVTVRAGAPVDEGPKEGEDWEYVAVWVKPERAGDVRKRLAPCGEWREHRYQKAERLFSSELAVFFRKLACTSCEAYRADEYKNRADADGAPLPLKLFARLRHLTYAYYSGGADEEKALVFDRAAPLVFRNTAESHRARLPLEAKDGDGELVELAESLSTQEAFVAAVVELREAHGTELNAAFSRLDHRDWRARRAFVALLKQFPVAFKDYAPGWERREGSVLRVFRNALSHKDGKQDDRIRKLVHAAIDFYGRGDAKLAHQWAKNCFSSVK